MSLQSRILEFLNHTGIEVMYPHQPMLSTSYTMPANDAMVVSLSANDEALTA
jgi:hypothetical protein